MSKRDNLGRYYRVQGNMLQRFTRDRRGQDTVDLEIKLAGSERRHKCGGKIMVVPGMPRILGDWEVCGKCSATVTGPGA